MTLGPVSLPSNFVTSLFETAEEGVILAATVVAVCGVAYAILTFSPILFLRESFLAIATFYSYVNITQMMRMSESLDEMQRQNTEYSTQNERLQESVDRMSLISHDFGSGIKTLGELEGRYRQLEVNIAEQSSVYARLNSEHAELLAQYQTLYVRWEALSKVVDLSTFV